MTRLRWWLWHHLSNMPGVCPAEAHSVLIWRYRRSVRIGPSCRSGAALNGACWCGKLRDCERDRDRDRSCAHCHGTGWQDTTHGAVPCNHQATA